MKKNNTVNNFFSTIDSYPKELDELKNINFNGININTLENREEDLGLTLAEAVFGKEKANRNNSNNYKSSIETEDDFYRNYYNDFINKKKIMNNMKKMNNI